MLGLSISLCYSTTLAGTQPRLFLITNGESNSGGYAENTGGPTAGELAARSSVQILNNTTLTRQDLDVGTNNIISHSGLTDNATHGIEIGLANTVEAGRYSTSVVELCKTGQGGSTIAQWATGHGSGYWSTAVSRVEAHVALLDAAAIAYTPVVLISLGINDVIAGTSTATFKTGLLDLIARWRTLLGSSTKVLLTKFQGPNLTAQSGINTVIDEIVAADANTYAIDTTGLTVRDSNHWDYRGFLVMAERLADILNGASGTLATPAASPAAGTFATTQSVTLSGPAGAVIRYTVDGTEPTSNSTVYSGAISVSISQTIKAVAFKTGWKNSAALSAAYAITAASTWDASAKGTGVSLTTGNTVATRASTTNFGSVRGTQGKNTGFKYFELELVEYTGDLGILTGLMDATTSDAATLEAVLGTFANSRGMREDGFQAATGFGHVTVASFSPTTGGRIMWAVDITNGSAWIGYNGTWQGSVTPVGGSTTGRTTSFTAGMTVFPACNVYTTSNKVRLRTAAAELSYSPPSGFSAWDS